MRLYMLDKNRDFCRATIFHLYMFNGVCARNDTDWPLASFSDTLACCLAPYAKQIAQLDVPLTLIRNGWKTPEVFWPGTHFIISSRVKEALSQHAGRLSFRPVTFSKLISVPYIVGDDSYYDDAENYKLPHELFSDLPDVPALHAVISRFYEVIAPSPSDVSAAYSDLRSITLSVPFTPYSGEETLMLSETLLADYPILDVGYRILSETALTLLSPFLDWDYFEIVELEC